MRRLLIVILLYALILPAYGVAQDIDLPETDSPSAISNSQLVMFWNATTGAITAQSASDVRAYSQQGIVLSGKLDTNLQNVVGLTPQQQTNFRTAIAVPAPVSVTSKLDTDLQNVASLSSAQQSTFLAAIGAGTSAGEQNVQSDWTNADTNADAFILNKPSLFSGDYNDLTNAPTGLPASNVELWAQTG